jgi:hypothetical protein
VLGPVADLFIDNSLVREAANLRRQQNNAEAGSVLPPTDSP